MEDAIDNRTDSSQLPRPTTDYDIAPDNRKKAIVIILLVTAVVWVPTLFGLACRCIRTVIGNLLQEYLLSVLREWDFLFQGG